MLNFLSCVSDSTTSEFFSQPCCLEDNPLVSDPIRIRIKVKQGLALSTSVSHNKSIILLFEEAIRLDPTNIEAFFNLGVVLQSENRLTEALSAYTRVLFLDPYHVPSLYNAGIINFDMKSYQISLNYFKQIIDFKSNVSDLMLLIDTYVNIGIVSLEMNDDTNQAIDAFKQALCLDPHCCAALINLANLYITTNTDDSAEIGKLYYRKVLEIEPSNEEAILFLSSVQ